MRALALLVAACGQSAGVPLDGQPQDAPGDAIPDAGGCGDGVVGPEETCDQGSLNGTAQSSCTVDCVQVSTLLPALAAQVFPSDILSFVDLTPYRVAALLSGSADITIASNLYVQNFDGRNVSDLRTIAVTGSVTSIARLPIYSPNTSADDELLWIEQREDGQHLFRADLATLDTNEIPYPFPSGSIGKLVNNEYISPVLIDVDAITHELLVAAISGQTSDSVQVDAAHLGVIGTDLGLTVRSSDEGDLIETPPGSSAPSNHRMLQFSADGKTFYKISIRQYANDRFALQNPYQISLDVKGTWPYSAVDGDMWFEGINATSTPEPALTHPQPYAIATTDGSIYIDTFSQSISDSSESFLEPYAIISGGAPTVLTLGSDGFSTALWALTTSGSEIVLWDGNNHDIHSSALAPQSKKLFSGAPANSTKSCFNQTLHFVSRGNVLFHL